jgi:nitroreductase
MQFPELIKARKSVRTFSKKEVEEEKLSAILEAANSAPSAGNLQAYEIYAVTSQEIKSRLAKAAFGQSSISEAGFVLVFSANEKRSASKYDARGKELYSVQDATIACAYAQLAAADQGLGCVWVGAFDEKEAAKAVGAGKDEKIVAILPIGYPGEKPKATPRRRLNDLVHWE